MVPTAGVSKSKHTHKSERKETLSRECFQDVKMLKGQENSDHEEECFVSLSVDD